MDGKRSKKSGVFLQYGLIDGMEAFKPGAFFFGLNIIS